MSDINQPLQKVSIFLEVSGEQLDEIIEAFEHVICSVDHSESRIKCPYRWFIISETLGAKKAAKWRDLLNE